MTRNLRWMRIVLGSLAAVALVVGTAGAANKTRVDHATRQVDRGAKQIGRGHVGPGFKEMFTGVGHTIVEGAKFSHENIKEFFAGKR